VDVGDLAADHGQQGQGVVPEDLRRPGRFDPRVVELRHLGHHVVERTGHIEHHTETHGIPSFGLPGGPPGGRRGAAGPGYRQLSPQGPPTRQNVAMSIAIVMGSSSDAEIMDDAVQVLRSFGVPVEVRVMSAHRTPDDAIEFARSASGRGVKVLIAAAGGAAHLAGVLAAATPLPVIGVPIALKNLGGLDSLLAMVQMPKGVPVATVAVNGARNAGLLAIRILALSDERIATELERFRKELADGVRDQDAEVVARYAEG
jgi:5-(carboxyamino)imidazole ribonucleotide mutase